MARLITKLVGWAVGIYLRVDRQGGAIPEGPVLVVANHLNALVDPLVIFRTAGRPSRPLAKATLFKHPMVGPALKGLGGLPVFRPRDDPEQVHRNEATFDAAIAALHAGEAVQIYPEGQSHSEPSLNPIRTGAARIALQAEEQAGWSLGLQIVPIGLVYQEKDRFRGSVVAIVGEPFGVGGWRAEYEADPRGAVRNLTEEIARRLTRVTLNVPSAEDRVLVETAEAVYARGRHEAAEREHRTFERRVGRLRAFARGLSWLRTHDPDEYERLRDRVRRYRRLELLMGSRRDATVPKRYDPAAVARYVIREGGRLLILTPFAAVAAFVWGVPYLLPRVVVRVVRPPFDAISTFKLCAAILVFPVAWAAWSAGAFLLLGPAAAVLVAVALPACGIAWIAWAERWTRVKEDVAVFLRAVRRGRLRTRLAQQREELAGDFDRIASLVDAG